MTQNRKLLVVGGAALLIGIFFLWLRQHEPSKVSGATANNLDTGVFAGTRAATTSVQTGSAIVAVDARSAAAGATGKSGGSATGLGWSKAVAIRDTRWTIEQLSISNDPNDRLRAYALAIICTQILLQPLDAFTRSFDERKKAATQRPDIAQMREDMQARCGPSENGNPYLPSSATRQGMWSARAAQVPLAITFDASLYGAAKTGLIASDADALSAVMRDESLRSAWIVQGLMSGLGQELSTSPNYAGATAGEMTAALMTALCRSGDDCGADSLYRPYLCFTSSFRFCDGATISEAVAADLNPNSTVRFENTVRQLQAALDTGDLEAFGLRRQKP